MTVLSKIYLFYPLFMIQKISLLQCELWLEILKISWNLIHGVHFPTFKNTISYWLPALIIHEFIMIFTINGKFQLCVTDPTKIAYIKYFCCYFLSCYDFSLKWSKLFFRDRKRHKMQAYIQPVGNSNSIMHYPENVAQWSWK